MLHIGPLIRGINNQVVSLKYHLSAHLVHFCSDIFVTCSSDLNCSPHFSPLSHVSHQASASHTNSVCLSSSNFSLGLLFHRLNLYLRWLYINYKACAVMVSVFKVYRNRCGGYK